jgi:hypothetical protein
LLNVNAKAVLICCEVDVALAGSFLVVADNHGCGGHNVSFTGIYTRRGRPQAR